MRSVLSFLVLSAVFIASAFGLSVVLGACDRAAQPRPQGDRGGQWRNIVSMGAGITRYDTLDGLSCFVSFQRAMACVPTPQPPACRLELSPSGKSLQVGVCP